MIGSEVVAVLPPLYTRWVRDFLDQPVPDETRSTCASCAMCETPVADQIVFNPDTKCCTYQPDLPNFLAGLILRDSDPSEPGRIRFLARMQGPALLRPQGVFPSLAEAAGHSLWNPGFGKDISMLCPYYLKETGGLCGIWQHRNARCATWFCKHIRGAVGRNFWRTLRELLSAVENHLSIWCIHQLKAGTPAFRELFPLPGAPNRELFQQQQSFLYRSALPPEMISSQERRDLLEQMWGEWQDREELFYRECATLVEGVDARRLLEIGGETVAHRLAIARQAFADMRTIEIPARLKAAPFRMSELSPGMVRVWAYSHYDPIDLPAAALESVRHFDGKPTESVIAWVAENTGFRLTRDMVQKMYDFEILQAVEE